MREKKQKEEEEVESKSNRDESKGKAAVVAKDLPAASATAIEERREPAMEIDVKAMTKAEAEEGEEDVIVTKKVISDRGDSDEDEEEEEEDDDSEYDDSEEDRSEADSEDDVVSINQLNKTMSVHSEAANPPLHALFTTADN